MKKATGVRRQSAFSIEHFSLSSYATAETSGKFTIAGMFSDQVVIPEKSNAWPPLYIVLIIIPVSQSFEYNLTLKNPQEEELIAFSATYNNNTKVDARERLALCLPLPQFPLKERGNHWFEISDGSNVLLRRCYEFVANEPEDVVFGEQTLKVRLGQKGEFRIIQ